MWTLMALALETSTEQTAATHANGTFSPRSALLMLKLECALALTPIPYPTKPHSLLVPQTNATKHTLILLLLTCRLPCL